MLRYDGFVLRKIDDPTQGNIASGISVAVRKLSDNTLADLFSDAAGTSPKGNPLTTDENGRYVFYVANGVYNIDVADGSASQQISIVNPEDILDEIDAAITAHVNAVDPHTQYARESDLATIATSGSYDDLTDKPTIPAAYSPEYTEISTGGTLQLVVNSKNKVILDGVLVKLPTTVGRTHKEFITVTRLRGLTFSLQSFANDNVINTTLGDTNQVDYTVSPNVYEDTYIFNSITGKWEL